MKTKSIIFALAMSIGIVSASIASINIDKLNGEKLAIRKDTIKVPTHG